MGETPLSGLRVYPMSQTVLHVTVEVDDELEHTRRPRVSSGITHAPSASAAAY